MTEERKRDVRNGLAVGVLVAVAIVTGLLIANTLDDEVVTPSQEAEAQAEVADQTAREAAEKAQRIAVRAAELTRRLAQTKAEVVTVTRDIRAAGIQGDPGESIVGEPGEDGLDGTDGIDGVDGSDSTVPGPAGADSIVPGPQGEQGPPGPGPTMQELIAALDVFFADNDFTCTPNVDLPGTFTCTFP